MVVLHTILLALVELWADNVGLPPVKERGLASGYAAWKPEWIQSGDKRIRVSDGNPYCWYLGKVRRGDPIIAHRTLPCGTKVYARVVGQKKGAWLTVGDRGPYGACARLAELKQLQQRTGKPLFIRKSKWCQRYGKDWVWYIKRHRSWPGHYRGVADISHAARKVLGHNGWQPVVLRYWHPEADRKALTQLTPRDLGLALSDALIATRDRRDQR